MESIGKNSGPVTPVKTPKSNRPKNHKFSKDSENSDPNFASPTTKLSNSAAVLKSAKNPQKSARKNPNPIGSPSPRNKIRERKFVVAKKNSKSDSSEVVCKCKINCKSQKCPTVAYEILRASQEDFFKSRANINNSSNEAGNGVQNLEEKFGGDDCLLKSRLDENHENVVLTENLGFGNVKRSRDPYLEEAQKTVTVPKSGSGKVMNLVKAFEQLFTIPNSKVIDEEDESQEVESDDINEGKRPESTIVKAKAFVSQVSSSSFCPSDYSLTSESLGLDPRGCSSLDSSQGSFTLSSRNSGSGRRSRRNSLESSGTFGGRHQKKRRHHRVTFQRPFNLRTEQRGKCKEEEFIKKVQEKMMEEEKQRIPVAQGLPWTTDEPECLVKPPVKESTRPLDLVLHSDVRAVERADFDHQVAEKMSYIEQYKMERERQQKLAEEEELKRLRKELVPIAQPMPYFDRPFIPRRSVKEATKPKEPKFQQLAPQHKKTKHYIYSSKQNS